MTAIQATATPARLALLLVAALPALVIAGAACGDDDDDDSGGSGAAPKTAWDVRMSDNSFGPSKLAVPVGQQVTISLRNSGGAVHNMRVAGPDGRYDNADDAVSQPESIRAGASGTLTLTVAAAGELRFRCDFHPTEMTGTITAK